MAVAGAFRTQADLVTETLANLGAIAVGQPEDPEDTAYVTAMYDATLRKLAALEICYVGDPNAIPGEYFKPLADIMAEECAAKFGVAGDDFTRLQTRGLGVPPGSGAGAMALKAITRGRPTFESLRVHYF